jgi:predicted cobalt transporter CbtA
MIRRPPSSLIREGLLWMLAGTVIALAAPLLRQPPHEPVSPDAAFTLAQEAGR